MQLAYLGTSPFAVTVLEQLAGSPFRPALVVTPPDRRQGRGRRESPPPVALRATELGIELHQTANVNSPESLAAIDAAGIDAAMVCAFGQLIRAELLERFEILNVHPSLLPRWRGAAPIERAIMAGDKRTGVAIMRLTEGLDSGPVALLEEIAIDDGEDFGALAARLAALGGRLSVRAYELAAAAGLTFTEQSAAGLTYAEKINPAERRLDPGKAAHELELTVRGLTPHVGAFLELDGGERLGVRVARSRPEGPAAGSFEARDGELVLGCGDGCGLSISSLLPAGKREMASADYLRGRELPRLAR